MCCFGILVSLNVAEVVVSRANDLRRRSRGEPQALAPETTRIRLLGVITLVRWAVPRLPDAQAT